MNSCAVCKNPAIQNCSACNSVFYCSKDHQKKDWKTHKNSCCPFKILSNDIMGRYLVATRDIQPGETILKKNPLILGPKMVTVPICLGCHQKIDFNNPYNCSKCKWPLCGKNCENSIYHKNECDIFAKNCFKPHILPESTKQSIYSTIVPLRVLLMKQSNPKQFEELTKCQSHLKKHSASPIYQVLKMNLVPLFIDKFNLETSEEEILGICSIFDTNSFEVRDSKGLVNIRGFYPTISLLAHNCKHNTKHFFSEENFQINLTATQLIIKGEMITTTYTQTLWGTLSRRLHLKQFKNFDCQCERCSDPTEFGTYAGSVLCTECSDNKKIVSTDPLDYEASWKCEGCDNEIDGSEMIWGIQAIRSEISLLDKSSPENLEGFLEKYESVLHPTNSHVLEIKYALNQMYGNIKGFLLKELPMELIERKIELCKDLLAVADILDPGYSRFRGCLLYDLQTALVERAKRKHIEGKIEKLDTPNILSEINGIAEECSRILATEPMMDCAVLEGKLEDLKTLINK